MSRHEDNPENIPAGLLIKWLAAVGTTLSEIEAEMDAPATGLDPGDPLASLWARLDLLQDFCAHERLEGHGAGPSQAGSVPADPGRAPANRTVPRVGTTPENLG